MFSFRWLRPPPQKPFYYSQMNPEERILWEIIGEEETISYFEKSGKIKTRKLTRQERAYNQKVLFDTRVGHSIVGDDWMRKALPSPGRKLRKEGAREKSDGSASSKERAGRPAGEWVRD
ncbi:hypothetical protein C7974DRAFT_383664 [Boeremia exigua]|uniref:uncharacterized protein n=1 Tax=Boeremia exigua TaxID=749465 RepID=UPI001E8ED28B|nr:uncharacterized protein C7974DRAFT_383664 [Boeremia exigua]KAH6644495.1 hypothetical protein C7974DRAFT_383664 [Boeremia exigua]